WWLEGGFPRGQLAESELDVIAQRLVALEESLLVAENDQLTRQETLMRLLGQPAPGGSPLQATSAPEGDALPLADEELIRVSRNQNIELRLLEEQIQTQRLNMVTSRDAVLPDLDLLMTITQQGLSNDGFGDASNQVFTFEAGTAFIGLSLNVPLDNGRAQAQYEADQIQLQDLEIQYATTERQVIDSVRAAARLMRLNQKRVDLGDRAVELSQRALQAEEARFRAGRSTNQSVIQFQEELQQAQSRVLRSRVDLIISVLRLRNLTGTLLDAYGIEVEPRG
ncbi:MAG: TolC family protein, partial [Myxococcota bacterium]